MSPVDHRHPLLAGSLAGGLEVLCTYPLEYIKTQLQFAPRRGEQPLSGTVDCIRRTVRSFGLLGLYRGLSANLAFAFPRTGIRFYVYETIARNPTMDAALPTGSLRVLLAGAAAGLIEAAACVIPMTTLQVRLVAEQSRPEGPRFVGLLESVRVIWRDEGPRGLYLGAGPTLLKITFNIGGRFFLYDRISRYLNESWDVAEVRNNSSSNSTTTSWGDSAKFNVVSMTAGGLAGAITVVANHPVDAVKTNMQCQPAGTYRSAMHCARSIADSGGGFRALYRGLIPRLNRVILETGLTFTFYQHISAACNTYLG